MDHLQLFPLAKVHMDTTWQARVKAAHRSHNVDTFEVLPVILFEDWRVLHGIFIGTGRAIDIAHTAVPGRGWIRMVIGDLSVLDHQVMGKHTAYSLVEAAAD